MRHVTVRFVLGVAIACALGLGPAARATHHSDGGWVEGGVSNEEQARAYPCPVAPAGGWERYGPVVCFAKRGPAWEVRYDQERGACYYDVTGYRGHCIFDFEEGDHIKVWGARGIQYTEFTVVWLHSAPSSTTRPAGSSPATTKAPGTMKPGATTVPDGAATPGAARAPGVGSEASASAGAPMSEAGGNAPSERPSATTTRDDRSGPGGWAVGVVASLIALGAAAGAWAVTRRRV